MFVGRERELSKLEQMYKSGKAEVAVVYGRRRIGKTTLINEFCKNKKTIFFAALESSADQNLAALSCAIAGTDGESGSNAPVFRSFSDAFERIAKMAERERIIFVIDEYPYLARAEKSISSLLQNHIDHLFGQTKIFIILCGSSMSFMEEQVLGVKSPLYGRRTAQFKILPFDYRDTGKWFPNWSYADRAIMYGVTGGVPLYIEQFSRDMSIGDNLLGGLFDRNALLFEEPSNLLKQELREPATYNAIIAAIASGKTKLSEISTTAGIDTSTCTKYITNLITLGIIRRETPVTEPKSRPIYLIDDMFFRFWYSFVPRNMAAVLSGRIADSFDSLVASRISDYMGLTFEAMCRDFILFYDRSLPINIGAIGQWWGGNKKTKSQAQIDVVATSGDTDDGIVGSCKFKNSKMPAEELDLLREYASAMGCFDKKYYYLFSKSGFADSLLDYKGEESVRLIGLGEMYGDR